MKRYNIFLLFVVALLLTSCSLKPESKSIRLYYKTAAFVSDSNQIPESIMDSVETAFDENVAPEILAELYFRGPEDENLVSPFPKGTHLIECVQQGTKLRIVLSDEIGTINGIDATLAVSCIGQTFLQLRDVGAVEISAETQSINGTSSITVTATSILLQDDTAMETTNQMLVYFPDTESRYVVPVSMTYGDISNVELVKKTIEFLSNDQDDGKYKAVIPEGTVLSDVIIENGICQMDFSAEFMNNAKEDINSIRIMLASIINSVTEIETIYGIKFLVNGESLESYHGFDLRILYQRDENIIGPVRITFNEIDASLFLFRENDGSLIELPYRLKAEASEGDAETLIRALLQYQSKNGLIGLGINEDEKYEIYTVDDVCYLVFFNTIHSEKGLTEGKIRESIEKTLKSLEGVNSVEIRWGNQ